MLKKYWRKRVCFLPALILMIGTFAACGQEQAETANNSEDTSAVSATDSAAPGDQSKNPGDYSGTLAMWAWDQNYVDQMGEEFKKIYTNVKIDVTPVQSLDYLQKLQTTTAAGGILPDVLFAEMSWRGKAFAVDVWENLENAPYNFDRSLIYDYLPALTSNEKGEIIGIEQTLSPAAMVYRRDLAREYLGTDDPKQLSEMFKDWDSFISKGLEVKQKSNGKVYMLSSLGDLITIICNQDTTTVYDGNSLNITGSMKNSLELMVKFRDSGVVDKLDQWSPPWNASYALGKTIFYPAANWSAQFVIKPNDKDGSGKWGFMVPPGGPFSWGGTAMGISKQSKNKEAAWEFIKWCTLTREGAQVSKEKLDFYVPLKEVYDDPSFATSKDDYFAGQDLGQFWFTDIVPNMQAKPISKYDNVISDANMLIAKAINADKKMTADKALENLIKEIKNKLPDVDVK